MQTQLHQEIIRLIEDNGVNRFASDMMPGPDLDAAEMVLQLRDRHPTITLECVIPYERQAVKWTQQTRDRYFSILEHCNQETMLYRSYRPDCMERTEKYMAQQADFLVWMQSRISPKKVPPRLHEYALSSEREIVVL